MSAAVSDVGEAFPVELELETSPQIAELLAALAKAQGAMGGASRSATNPHFNRQYADLAAVWDAIRGPLSTNGLSIVQAPASSRAGVSVVTLLGHATGQWMRSRLRMPVQKLDAQGLGSAITYARRYALMAIAGIAPEDDDGNGAVHSGPPQQQGPRAVPPPPPAQQPKAPPPASKGAGSLAAAEEARAIAHSLREAGVAGDLEAVQQLWVDACKREKAFGSATLKRVEAVYLEAMAAVESLAQSERRALDGGAA